MNNKYMIGLAVLVLMIGSACNKYLDVQPEASYSETQVYNNTNAVKQALNGLYISMAGNSSYGASLSATAIEYLGQRFQPAMTGNGSWNFGDISGYQYTSVFAANVFDSVWKAAYANILAANVFLSKVETSVNAKLISQEQGNQMKGEATAIRAMLHFDMLRLYGPVFSSSPLSPAIPYYTGTEGTARPVLSATDAVDKVIADLVDAAALLAKDPVIDRGVVDNKDFFTGMRNQRLNYYAVKALMARVYLWAGKNELAHSNALSVLNEGEKWFPWTDPATITNGSNPDRIFSKEVLFGIYNPQLYTIYNYYFAPTVESSRRMVPSVMRLNQTFENNTNDYRYMASWATGTTLAFSKFAPTYNPQSWSYVQPLIRKSEMYLILAETEKDQARALDYLNTERRRRGLAVLPATVNLSVEIRKEYQKEFWGEGQLFFYYKRKNASDVPYAAMPYDWYTIMPDYIVPLPFSETSPR